jgi:3-oxoacyl-[acyl-carrier protein] reductase
VAPVLGLSGSHVLITGGGRGLGGGLCEAFLAAGADVSVLDVLDAEAGLRSAAQAAGRSSFYCQADVSDERAVREGVAAATAAIEPIDVLINNAAVTSEHRVADMPVSEWDRVLAVNLRGVFICTHHVLPGMLARRRGRIINIASQLGQIGGATMAHYSASKAGVIGFTKALAREVVGANVLVNAIAPGPIETEMLASESTAWRTAKLREIPLGRFAGIGEIVPTALFLASEASRYYVGQVLSPNGGEVML